MDIETEGTSRQGIFTRISVFNIWKKYDSRTLTVADRDRLVFNDFLESLEIEDKENKSFEHLQAQIEYICKKIYIRWKQSNYTTTRFLAKNHNWLNTTLSINSSSQESIDTAEDDTSLKPRGRPRKSYKECSKRTQQRRRLELSQLDESMASALGDQSSSSIGFNVSNESGVVSTSDVLSLLVEAKLTKHQYMLIKEFVNNKISFNLLPSYKSVLKEKQNCYPNQITVTDDSAEVELQALLDHTASRLLESQKDVLESFPDNDGSSNDLLLIGKWGFDGSTGHSEYKQSFCASSAAISDDTLFVTSYVPLQILKKHGEENVTVWKNPRPSSTRYCRPVRFQLKKETAHVSVEEERYFTEKINALQPTVFNVGNRSWTVRHNLQLTMIDGKVCNALSDTSSTKCYICQATPKEMNNLDLCVQKTINENRYDFGLSPLHAWIRFFEFFLHVSYRLDVKTWQVRGQDSKDKVAERKKSIQSKFWQRMSLIVDKPKPGGSGSSNDGNTARKFFQNPEISSEITGIDKNLIERCATILQALNSGYKINADKFGEFAMETAKQIIQTYPWYYLPASIHKVLVHGSAVIEHALLPIGELSEEAAESRNKDIKAYRLRFTRKISRNATNTDLINRLLLSSDPLITGLRKLPQKKKSVLSKSVLELLSF